MELSPWPSVGLLQLAVLLWHLSVAAIASQFQGDSLGAPEFLRTGSDESLQIIHDIATGSFGSLCLSDAEQFRSLPTPVDPLPFDSVRQKADMAAAMLQDFGVTKHAGSGILGAMRPKCSCTAQTHCAKPCALCKHSHYPIIRAAPVIY